MKAFFKRRLKRLQEFLYRLDNFRHYRAKGLPLGLAWKKSDLTL